MAAQPRRQPDRARSCSRSACWPVLARAGPRRQPRLRRVEERLRAGRRLRPVLGREGRPRAAREDRRARGRRRSASAPTSSTPTRSSPARGSGRTSCARERAEAHGVAGRRARGASTRRAACSAARSRRRTWPRRSRSSSPTARARRRAARSRSTAASRRRSRAEGGRAGRGARPRAGGARRAASARDARGPARVLRPHRVAHAERGGYLLRLDPALLLEGTTAYAAAPTDLPGRHPADRRLLRPRREPRAAHVRRPALGARDRRHDAPAGTASAARVVDVAELAQLLIRGENPRHRALLASPLAFGYWVRVDVDQVRSLDAQYRP